MRYDIINSLEKIKDNINVIFIWKDNKNELGFSCFFYGENKAKQVDTGLFNHLFHKMEMILEKK